LKAAELLSTLGAGVLGAGLALLWPRLADEAWPLLALGLLAHATGMGLKHRLQRGQAQPPWAPWLSSACWLALAALAVAIAWRIFTG
jgi:hypothetical protein